MNPPPQPPLPSPDAGAPMPSPMTPGSTPPVLRRRYPKPPPLLKRFALLIVKPEAWPMAAMYPLWVTLLPLALAILIAAGAAGVAAPVRVMRGLDAFDRILRERKVDLMVDSEGVLSTATPMAKPISFMLGDQHILIDPSGATSPEMVKEDWVTLVTRQSVFSREPADWFTMIRDRLFSSSDASGSPGAVAIKDVASVALPDKGKVSHINSDVLKPFVVDNRGVCIFILAVMGFLLKLFTETLWVAATMFFIFHTVRIGAALGNVRLAIPKRVACRIAAAVLVPVVLFSGLTNASGYSLTSLVGYQNSLIVWFFVATALALWAGYLTKALFTSKPVRRRAT